MFLRNKGTASKPKWQVIESRRVAGKDTPRQKVICTLGDIKNPSDLIKRWELILDDARTAERTHMELKSRNKKFPLLKQYARRLSFDEVRSRHDKIVATAERLEWQKKRAVFRKQLKIKKEFGLGNDANKAMEFSENLTALLQTISGILADDNLKDWSSTHMERMRERMAEVINFYHRL